MSLHHMLGFSHQMVHAIKVMVLLEERGWRCRFLPNREFCTTPPPVLHQMTIVAMNWCPDLYICFAVRDFFSSRS